MMSFERSNTLSLPSAAGELLAELWRQVQADERQFNRERLRTVARQVSLGAHEAGMRPEELIIVVKESWAARARPGSASERQRLQWLLSEMISACIDEFYHTLRDAGPARVSPDRRRWAGPKGPEVNL